MIVRIDDDFDLARIAQSGQCFRWRRVEDSDGDAGVMYRVIHGSSCVYIAELGDGKFSFECDEEMFGDVWRSYLDLDESYRDIRARVDRDIDPFLWNATEHERGIRILRQDPWETLVSFIISQNKNIPAIERSIELVAQAAGEERIDSRGVAYYSFPSPEQLAELGEDRLKECKLGYRAKYVAAAAHAVADSALDLEALTCAGEPETMEELTKLFGVGVKVASCVSLFGLHHLDAFPIDVWVKRILENEYPDGYPYERYHPYNGVCQQYMFAYYRSHSAKP